MLHTSAIATTGVITKKPHIRESRNVALSVQNAHLAQWIFSKLATLLGSLLIPFHCLSVILLYSSAPSITIS